jgi:hypothetical protein
MSSGKNFADVVRSVPAARLFSLNSEVEKSSFVLIVVLVIENPFHALSATPRATAFSLSESL